jgi:predicted metal-binding membrane protein
MFSDGRRERDTTLILAVLACLSWVAILYQWHTMPCRMCSGMSIACPMCMGTGKPLFLALSSFLGMWSVMMAAMMLPSVSPMVLLFSRVSRTRRGPEASGWPTWCFAAGYLVAWALTGFAAFAFVRALHWGLGAAPGLLRFNKAAAASVLVAAGVYQLSPLKNSCLNHCRSPLDFLAEHWREGPWGAFRMGGSHALYCIGCCWGLMAVMFAVGLMNLAWMAGLTVVMALEKIGTHGLLIGRLAGAAFIAFGIVFFLH